MLRKLFITTFLCGNLLFLSVYAQAKQTTEIIIAPTCLYQQVDIADFEFLAKNKDYALIQIDQKGLDAFILAKENHQTACGGFTNVTNEWKQALSMQSAALFLKNHIMQLQTPRAVNYSIQYEKEVKELMQKLDPQNLWTNLITLTEFHNRCAVSETGKNTADWLLEQARQLAEKAGRTDVTYTTIAIPEHPNYIQPSVVIKVGNGDGPGIVIGAHMDTICLHYGRYPGADDDGTGTVTVLETLRLILNSNMQFKKPIYFIWYAAEEEGLLGSRAVVNEFVAKRTPIDAVIQFDMTGYPNNDRTMWLIDDYVNKDLSEYLAKLISVYVGQPIKHTQCGYACSDHASWTQKGYAAAMPAETAFKSSNPFIHTDKDTIANLSILHMTDYAKLAIAFAVELGEPVNT